MPLAASFVRFHHARIALSARGAVCIQRTDAGIERASAID